MSFLWCNSDLQRWVQVKPLALFCSNCQEALLASFKSSEVSFSEQVYHKRVYLVATGDHVPLLRKARFLNFTPFSFHAKVIVF